MLDTKLYTFLQLAQCSTTLECARLLHLTQPAVSQHIKALETQYGTKLFQKEGRRLVLTSQGKRLFQLCQRLHTMDQQIHREMRQASQTSLQLGVTLSIAHGCMAQLMPRLLDAFCPMQLHLNQQNTAQLLHQLDNGQLDLAFLEGNFAHHEYTYRPFYQSRFVGLCAPFSPWISCTQLTQLLDAPLLLRETGSGTRDIFESECRARNLDPSDFSTCSTINHIPTLLELTAQGRGITFAYEAAAQSLLKEGRLAVIPLQDFVLARSFHGVWLPGHPQEQQFEQMVQLAQQVLAQ